MDADVAEAVSILAETIREINETDLSEQLARFYFKMFTELQAQGFSHSAALNIVVHMGSVTSSS